MIAIFIDIGSFYICIEDVYDNKDDEDEVMG
jgi:hypothetical protein